ncbi:MAG: DUF2059 domain-containing protein [Proteobacteria bacterium]|nr:DUF2059 domain-containing protein [Pseudomonadota bacterium]
MNIKAMILCALGVSAVSTAWADAASKAAKIAELMHLTGARQTLHELDGKFDQEDAARAWERFYSENVTESDLDAILAYYRSPAGQADVSASRAALGRVQHYMVEKRSAAQVGRGVGSAPDAQGGGVTRPAVGGTTAGSAAGSGTGAGAPIVGTVGSASNRASSATATPARPWDTQPRAPDGRIVPSPTSPEGCEVAPSAAPAVHPVPPSGRSVVCVCTDEKGTLTRDPVIAESSGDSRVDSGALKMARVDSGRYVPPTLAGHPQSACFRFAIDFRHQQ